MFSSIKPSVCVCVGACARVCERQSVCLSACVIAIVVFSFGLPRLVFMLVGSVAEGLGWRGLFCT